MTKTELNNEVMIKKHVLGSRITLTCEAGINVEIAEDYAIDAIGNRLGTNKRYNLTSMNIVSDNEITVRYYIY